MQQFYSGTPSKEEIYVLKHSNTVQEKITINWILQRPSWYRIFQFVKKILNKSPSFLFISIYLFIYQTIYLSMSHFSLYNPPPLPSLSRYLLIDAVCIGICGQSVLIVAQFWLAPFRLLLYFSFICLSNSYEFASFPLCLKGQTYEK